MNKRYILIVFVFFFLLILDVSAGCNTYATQGKNICITKSDDGYMCEWDSTKKGGARCFKGDKKANNVVEDESPSENVDEENENSTQNTTEDIRCNIWASQGKDICVSKSYKGYKCEWDGNKKGGARCFQGDMPANTESVTNCSQLSSYNVCSPSKVNGYQCVWKQNECFNGENDGSGETNIIDNNDKSQDKQNSNQDFEYLAPIHLGELSCDTIFKNDDGSYNQFYYLFWNVLKIMKYAAIALTLGLSLMDFIKVISSGDKDELKKATNRSIKRLIIGIILFFLPTLLNFALEIIGDYTTCNIL